MIPAPVLLAVLAVAVGTAGVVLLYLGLRPATEVTVAPPRRTAWWSRAVAGPLLGPRLALGLAAGIVVCAATGWPVAGLACTGLVIVWPALFGAAGATRDRVAQLEALALWTESLKDLVSGASGLSEAIPISVASAPPLLQPPLQRLSGQLAAREPLPEALHGLAVELADPTADLVIAALLMNARARGPGLAASLHRLADSIREELELRRRIEAARRGGRRNVQIMITMVLLMATLMIFVFPPQFSQPYRTVPGQLVLLAVCGIFTAAFIWLRRLADPDIPDVFLTEPGARR